MAQLEALLDSLDRNPRWTPERSASLSAISRFFAEDLCSLIRKEDEILYPALSGLFPTDPGPLSVLRKEHRDLCLSFRKMYDIGKSLNEGDNPPETLAELQRSGRMAADVLEDHLYKEDRVLFPMAARFLTPERDTELIRKMENFDLAEGQPAAAGQPPSSE